VNTVVIKPANPFDFENAELDELAEHLRQADSSFNIEISAQPERGYGVTPYEVIELVATIGGAITALESTAGILSTTVKWARERWQRDRDKHRPEPPRPRVVKLIYGPDGRILKEVLIDLPDGDPVENPNPHK
jgi:hypothetical protein